MLRSLVLLPRERFVNPELPADLSTLTDARFISRSYFAR